MDALKTTTFLLGLGHFSLANTLINFQGVSHLGKFGKSSNQKMPAPQQGVLLLMAEILHHLGCI